jgi:hypothetical protein
VIDVADRAKRWEELRGEPGDWIRVLDGEAVVSLPVTAFDAAIVETCGQGWMDSLRLAGRIIAENPIGFSLLTWRIRELLRAGSPPGMQPPIVEELRGPRSPRTSRDDRLST